MTTPKVATLSQGGSRYYVHPTTSEKVPGVTSVLNALPKPFLTPWSTKLVAEAAVDNLDAVAALAAADRQGAVDYLKGAPRRSTASSADLGTAAHGIFERMCLGQHIGMLTDDVMPFVKHFSNFFDTVQPEFIEVEQTVWSDTHKYGGSFDGLAKIDGVTCWLDLKTGKSIHADVALQLAAYAHAEVMLKDGEEVPLPQAERGLVLHCRADMGWTLTEVPIDDEVFDHFLALRKTFAWTQMERQIIGKPLAVGGAS